MTTLSELGVTNTSIEEMINWDFPKKVEFCDTVTKKALFARVVMNEAAGIILESARSKHFVPNSYLFVGKVENRKVDVHAHHALSRDDMDRAYRVAKEKANSILKTIPSSAKVVRVLSKDIGRKMDRVEAINSKLAKLDEQLTELPSEISLSEVPQSWTIQKFRDHVKAEIKKRESLVRRINKLGVEGTELSREISKFLYDGVPGIKEAVVEVVTRYYKKSAELGDMVGKVTDLVKFGDSDEAMAIIAKFSPEVDRVELEAKKDFTKAIEILGVSKAQVRARGKKDKPATTPVKSFKGKKRKK